MADQPTLDEITRGLEGAIKDPDVPVHLSPLLMAARRRLNENELGPSAEIERLRGLIREVLENAPGDDASRFMLLPHALAESGWFKRASAERLNIQQPIGGAAHD